MSYDVQVLLMFKDFLFLFFLNATYLIYKNTHLQHVTPLHEDIKMDDTLAIIELLSNKIKHGMDILSSSDNKYLETMDETLLDKVSFNYL